MFWHCLLDPLRDFSANPWNFRRKHSQIAGRCIKNMKVLQPLFQGIGPCYRLNTYSGTAFWTPWGFHCKPLGLWTTCPNCREVSKKNENVAATLENIASFKHQYFLHKPLLSAKSPYVADTPPLLVLGVATWSKTRTWGNHMSGHRSASLHGSNRMPCPQTLL